VLIALGPDYLAQVLRLETGSGETAVRSVANHAWIGAGMGSRPVGGSIRSFVGTGVPVLCALVSVWCRPQTIGVPCNSFSTAFFEAGIIAYVQWVNKLQQMTVFPVEPFWS